MRLGIMQPYFFPYLGHFALIAQTDRWIVFDITQYTPRSWISRNRVLHPSAGWNYVSVPLANSSMSIRIHEARIADPAAAGRSIQGKLSHYRRRAPHYEAVQAIVAETFAHPTGSLVDLNVRGLEAVCRYLGITLNLEICSRMELSLPERTDPGLWALEICTRIGAHQYLNPIGGLSLFDPARFAQSGVALQFLRAPDFKYDTAHYAFEPGLSILDVMMWNRPEAIREAIVSQSSVVAGQPQKVPHSERIG
jgi:WbqC-like protein family